MDLTQLTSLLSNWQGLLVVGMLFIISCVALFLLSKTPTDSKIALQTLVVIRSVLAVKLGKKGILLVDAWIAGLEQIKDGEFSDADRVDQFVRFLRIAASNQGIELTDTDVENIQTLVMTTLDTFVGKKPKAIAVAVNKFNAMSFTDPE
jgi:hypothetical protein